LRSETWSVQLQRKEKHLVPGQRRLAKGEKMTSRGIEGGVLRGKRVHIVKEKANTSLAKGKWRENKGTGDGKRRNGVEKLFE